MSLTQDELIVGCGALAWLFNLKRKRDPTTGEELPVPLDKSNSLLIIKPDPFQMAFEPRSEKRKMEALRLWEEAEAKDRAKREQWLRNLREGKPNVIKEPKVPPPTVQISPPSPAAAVPAGLVNGDEKTNGLSEKIAEGKGAGMNGHSGGLAACGSAGKAVEDLRKEAELRIKIARLDSSSSM